jgi:cytochrome c556
MVRTVFAVVGTLFLGVGSVMAQQEIAVQQDNLMRGQAKSLYTVMLKMVKGEIPYDQAAVVPPSLSWQRLP